MSVSQHGNVQSGFASSLSSPSPVTVNNGDTVVIIAFGGNGSPTASDSGGVNVYTQVAVQPFNAPNGFSSLNVCQNAVGGSLTLSVAQPPSTGICFFWFVIPAAALSGGLDAVQHSEATNFTVPTPGPAITTIAANATVITCIAGASNATTAATSSSGTILDTFPTQATFIAGASSVIQATAPGSYSDTLNFVGQNFNDQAAWTISIAPGATGPGPAAKDVAPRGPGISPGGRNQFRAAPRAVTTTPSFFWVVQMGAVVGLTSALTTGARTGGQGFVSQPGPGVGPFSNSQFQSSPRAVTSAPQSFLMASRSTAQVSFNPSLSQLQLFAASCGAVASMTATMTTQAASGGIGYLTQPGPGVGPFSNSQFQSAPRSTNQPFQQLIGALSAGAKVSVTASLTTGLTMASAGGAQVSATPALNTGLNLATSMGAVVSGSPALTSGISLAVNAGGFVSATAALSSGINLAVSSQAIVSASGAIGAGAQFAVSASGQVQSTAALATGLSLAATSGAQVSLSATPTTGISLAAQSGAIASATQGMSAAILLASQPAGQVGSVSALSSGIQLASGSQAQVSLTGSFTVGSAVLASFAAAQVAISVALNAQITMAVQHGAKASMITAMTTAIQMQTRGAAIASFQSTAQGQIPNLSGSPNLVESDYEQRIVTRN